MKRGVAKGLEVNEGHPAGFPKEDSTRKHLAPIIKP